MPGSSSSSSRAAASPPLGFSRDSSSEACSVSAVEQQVAKNEGLDDGGEAVSSRRAGGVEFPRSQRWQQHKRHPLHLSSQEVADITKLCLGVIEEYEEEKALLASAISSKRRLHDSHDSQASAESLEDRRGDALSPGGKNARRRIEGEPLFADYAALRPAYFQELRLENADEATGDTRATGDSTLSEEDVALYAKRTVAALLLASPWPLRLEDLRKRWQTTPLHARKRNLTALVLRKRQDLGFLPGTSHDFLHRPRSTASVHSYRFRGKWPHICNYILIQPTRTLVQPHLLLTVSLITKRGGEEELRGFLLFLSAQFLSARAELPLETLKAHLRLVGRSDLLRDFDEASLLKTLHGREQPLDLDSLEAFLSYCESLKYITIVRRSLGADADIGASIFILPTGRLLHELQSDAFRAECLEHFGIEPPDTPLHPPEAEPPDSSRPSQSGAPTQQSG
ncbi:hypothetical protein Emed_003569 [Eimeria media]